MRTEHTPKNHRIKDFSKEPRASARGIIGRGCVLGAATPKPLLAIHPRASARGILADFVKNISPQNFFQPLPCLPPKTF